MPCLPACLPQSLAVASTLGIACVGGLLAGWLVSHVNLMGTRGMATHELFDDGMWWHGCEVRDELWVPWL